MCDVWEDLRKKGFKPTRIDKNGRIYAMTFEIPKGYVRITMPRRVKPLSTERKAQLREQLKNARDKRSVPNPV